MKRFDVGSRVMEPTYGLGSVVAVEDNYTRVQFDEHGLKKFLTSNVPTGTERRARAGRRSARSARNARQRRRRLPRPRPGRRLESPLQRHRHPLTRGGHDRGPERRILLDRVEKISHLAPLVHHVVRDEQSVSIQARIHQARRIACSRVFHASRNTKSNVPCELAESRLKRLRRRLPRCRRARPVSRWPTAPSPAPGRTRSSPAVRRCRAGPSPIQIALYPLAPPISSARSGAARGHHQPQEPAVLLRNRKLPPVACLDIGEQLRHIGRLSVGDEKPRDQRDRERRDGSLEWHHARQGSGFQRGTSVLASAASSSAHSGLNRTAARSEPSSRWIVSERK